MKRFLLLIPAILLPGCGSRVEQYVLPDQITNFDALFANNCSGCHGSQGRKGAAPALNDPAFLAVIGKQDLTAIISNGVPGTPMPAFAKSAGGDLTNEQIAILADQIEKRWSRPQDFVSAVPPPYRTEPGDSKLGKEIFRQHCASCHGEDGNGTAKAGSIVDPAYLALISDQSLRTTMIVGSIDRTPRDWRSCAPESPMSSEEISDVVAWLGAHRAPVNLTQRGESR
jgi:cytochrome c oxidase cbb3-type subunit III